MELHQFVRNYCGLSPEGALIASKYVHFVSSRKPDKVVLYLKSYGFTQEQIAKLVRRQPPLLVSNTDKTLAPKFEFLQSKGLTTSQIIKILTFVPSILRVSVRNRLSPSFDTLTELLHSDTKALLTVQKYPFILTWDIEKNKVINLFRQTGIPKCYIATILYYYPRIFSIGLDKAEVTVNRVKEFGFNPVKYEFVDAFVVLCSMRKSTWDRKLGVYKKWDLSEEQILQGFRKKPVTMSRSDEMITGYMRLFVDELGWEPTLVMRNSVLFSYSLEKRLIPRASVLKFLLDKGMVKKGGSFLAFFMYTEERSWRSMSLH